MTAVPSAFAPGDLAVDHELAAIAESYRFILDVTPVNVEQNRASFLDGSITEPAFTYRELEDDPDVICARLSSVDVASVEDPTLGHLLRAKHREIELQLEMLRVLDTPQFLPLSIELYGAVAPGLLERAQALLDRIDTPAGSADRLDAAAFAACAELELEHYRAIDPDIGIHVEVRPDATGVMVAGDHLLVGSLASIPLERVDALLQHEVGTHLITQVNGASQPVRVMAAGLAGYEETQEGLAVLAEHLVGGLSAFRMRQLAARVVAVHQMVVGDSFAEVHRMLVAAGFSPNSSFTTAMRTFRGGGFTKDAIYLRGLVDLVQHVAGGGDLGSLWLGKLSLRDLPLVDDLHRRGLLQSPRLLPRYLDEPGTAMRLARVAQIDDITDMIERTP